MGFASFHRQHGHKTPESTTINKRAVSPNPTCSTGGFYKAPTSGVTIDSLKPLDIEWDSTCFDTELVDIHLVAPWIDRLNTELTAWYKVPFSKGKATVNIKPKWWNSTSSAKLQLTIVPAGTPPSLVTLPAGPLFTATYTPPADGSIPPSADTTKPDTPEIIGASTNKHLSPGQTAAAVLLPLLAILGLGIFAYLRWQRRKAAKNTMAFSQAVDKRMSTISTDWKSMSPAGAQAAIRASVAVRDSTAFGFGAIRPLSSTASNFAHHDGDTTMTQVRTGTGVGLRHPNASATALAAQRASRISKVSFADSARPSGEIARRTKALNSTYIPPVPTTMMTRTGVVSTASVYPDSELERDEEKKETNMSPRQATGPLTLTSDDIRSRMIHGQQPGDVRDQDKEYDEVMPALSMMRTGLDSTAQHATADDYIIPAPPAPIYASQHTSSSSSSPPPYTSQYTPTTATSAFTISAYGYAPNTPSSPLSPLPPLPSPVGAPTPPPQGMSPDDMLRAYAERQSGAPAPVVVVNTPGSPKTNKGGRKLSLRASFGLKKSTSHRNHHQQQQHQPYQHQPYQYQQSEVASVDKTRIGYPTTMNAVTASPASPVPSATGGEGAGMAGVGARKMGGGMGGMAGVGASAGMAGVGAASYAIGEDDEEDVDYDSAYVGTAN